MGCPFRGRMPGHCEVNGTATVVREDADTNSKRNVAVGTTKKSTETSSLTWLLKKVRHVWEGGGRCRAMYLVTVVS